MQRRDRILIVDDHPTNIEVLEEILGDDYHLATATSGEEALAIASTFGPALILLDIMMPGIDGYETCRRLRTNPALCYVKIIIVSAKAMVTERLHGYEAGADDYITKPFDNAELLAKVRIHLRLKSVEEVDQLKTSVLTLLSHETRTPLNGIVAPITMLMQEEEMDAAERTTLLGMVHQSARRLLRFFEQVTKLSTMKAGKWDFEFAMADLCALVRDAICEVMALASERGVQIGQELPKAAITLLDQEQMRHVVTALLDNAIRYSPLDGLVMVRISRHDNWFCVTVSDQGEGIDPDMLPHVFQEFPQIDIRHHSEGHGLSLAIARQTVLAHHGTIGVESTKGLSTTSTVLLPAAMGARS